MSRAIVIGTLLGVSAAGAQVSAPPVPQIVAPMRGQAQPTGPTGSVSGTVSVQDTQRPARFAQVMLQSVTTGSGQGGDRFGGGFGSFGGASEARTDADGTFVMSGVAPGDYYVTAGAAGYIPERALLQTAVAAGADPAALLARIPVVHVVADSTSSVNVTLQRGGALSGHVLWEDGSPATGIPVTAVLNIPAAALPSSLQMIRSPGANSSSAVTDDRGVFRISGMAAGDYLLQAVIQSSGQYGGAPRPQMVSTVRVYAPGVFHKAAAKPVTVHVGEERDDVRMTIDLRGLHMVAGHASSASAGQNIASGRVTLTDPTDPALQLMGSIQADGTFTVHYVPPGSYTLQIAGASTQANSGFGGRGRGGGTSSSGTSFQPLSMAITVTDGDLTGVAAMLTPVSTTP